MATRQFLSTHVDRVHSNLAVILSQYIRNTLRAHGLNHVFRAVILAKLT